MAFVLPPLEIALHEQPPEQDLLSLLNGLLSFNRPLEPEGRYTRFAVFLRDGEDRLRGGLTGALYFNALFIEHLYIDEDLRGQGLGRLLVACAENEALARGRNLVHLETMSFQAPGFFAALGYREYARLAGYPDEATRVHFFRDLAGDSGTAPAWDDAPVRPDLRIEAAPDPAEADLRVVQDAILAFNARVFKADAPHPLSIFVRGPGGQVFGGLSGSTCWNGCFIDLFWLDYALRRQGIGTNLMRLAEQEARARGCAFIHLETFSFQARGFYEKLGFAVYGTVSGFPDGVERYHLVKRLAAAAPGRILPAHADEEVRA